MNKKKGQRFQFNNMEKASELAKFSTLQTNYTMVCNNLEISFNQNSFSR